MLSHCLLICAQCYTLTVSYILYYTIHIYIQYRRDNCLLVRTVVDTCLRKILIDRDVAAAIDYAKGTIADLLQNKLDISMVSVVYSV